MKGGFEFPSLVNIGQIYVIVHHAKDISISLDIDDTSYKIKTAETIPPFLISV